MSGSSDTTPPGEAWVGYDMTLVLAPFFWGTIISFILSGITIMQAYTYFPSKDCIGIQLVAAAMMILDISSTVLCAIGMFTYLIPHFGSLLPFATFLPALSAECFLSAIITFISQVYFGWQISILAAQGRVKYLFSSLVILFAIVSFGGGIASSTIMIADKTHILANRSYAFSVAAGIGKSAATLSDTIATIALCYWLQSIRIGFGRSDFAVKSLIGYFVQRGILVTMIQTLFLIVFFGSSTHLYWLALHVNVTRLYAITFFAMLSGRTHLKKIINGDDCLASGDVDLSFLESGCTFSRHFSGNTSNGTESQASP